MHTNYVMFSFLSFLASGMDYINFISNVIFSGECQEVYQLLYVYHITDRYFRSIVTKQIGICQEFNGTLAKKFTTLLLISCVPLKELLCTTNYVTLFSLLLFLMSGMEYVKFISNGVFSSGWNGVYQLPSQYRILNQSF